MVDRSAVAATRRRHAQPARCRRRPLRRNQGDGATETHCARTRAVRATGGGVHVRPQEGTMTAPRYVLARRPGIQLDVFATPSRFHPDLVRRLVALRLLA